LLEGTAEIFGKELLVVNILIFFIYKRINIFEKNIPHY
jgi:hypothetical protein